MSKSATADFDCGRLEGWTQARSRFHPSRRAHPSTSAQERAPQDEVRIISHALCIPLRLLQEPCGELPDMRLCGAVLGFDDEIRPRPDDGLAERRRQRA